MGRYMICVCCICGESAGKWNDGWRYQDFCPNHSDLLKNRIMKLNIEMREEDVNDWSEKLNKELAKLLVRKETIESILKSIEQSRFNQQVTHHENIYTPDETKND